MEWFKYLGAAAAVAFGIGTAQAELITAGGPNAAFSVIGACTSITGCNGGTPNSTVSAEADFSNFVFSGANNSTLTLTLTLTNTTQKGTLSTALWDSVRLTDFGFNTNPDAASISSNSSVYTTVTNSNFPGFNTVDVCEISGGGNNCAGGAGGGLFPAGSGLSPNSDTFQLVFTGLAGSLDLGTNVNGGTESFDFKIQSDFGSFEFAGSPNGCPPGTPGCVVNPPTNVPEPDSLALLGTFLIGLGGLAWWKRRRNSESFIPGAMA